MDPKILNYVQNLQSAQQLEDPEDDRLQQQAMQEAMQQGMPPEQQMQQPMMQQQAPQQQAPQQPQYNPFNSGISNAIESARVSLGMTEKQKNKAFRRAVVNFGSNIARQPKTKGFFNNFGQISRSMLPAIQTYDDVEDQYSNQNNVLANQMLAHQAAEQQRLSQEDERQWQRGFKESQLRETRRSHDLMNASKNNSSEPYVEFEGSTYRKLDKIERRKAGTFKKKAGNTLVAVKEINEAFDKLNNLTKDNLFGAIGGASKGTNIIKDNFGRYANTKVLKKETAARKDLAAKLGNLTAVLEAVKAGGGKLGQGMYDRLKPNFPDLNSDDDETIMLKMDSINKEIQLYYDAAAISADYGIAYDPYDAYEKANSAEEENIDNDTILPLENSGFTIIYDPDNPSARTEVDNEDLNEALQRGWKIEK